MPFCTCSLFCGGRKGCEIWSMFQEKQLSTSPSRRTQVGLLPCFGHFIPLHRARLILQEEEGEEAGSRSRAGRCRIRGLTDSGTCMTWWGCTSSVARKPSRGWPGAHFRACSLLCWVCRHFEGGKLGHAWKPLPPFMIGTACKEKLSFFPRACGTSLPGPACCRAKVYHERGCDISAC